MILVTGARGRVGRAVLDGLLAAGVPAGDLLASSRDPAQLDLPAGVDARALDLGDPAALAAAFAGVEQVFLYASGEASAVADAARTAGVRHVVLLSSLSSLGAGTDDSDDPDDRIGAMHRAAEAPWHGAGAAGVEAGIETTFLRPGAFAANTLDWADGVRAGLVELPRPDSHVTPIHEDDIADVAVDALVGGPARGTAAPLTGPESLSFRAQVAVLAAEVGRPVEVRGLSDQEYRDRMGRFAPPWVADSLLHLWSASDGVPQPVHDVAPLLGMPGRTFAQWAHEHRAAFM